MSRARDYRRDGNGRAVDPFQKRKRRYKGLLRVLGAEALFAATPRAFQEALWRGKRPEPRVIVEDGVDPRVGASVANALHDVGAEFGGGRVTFADLVAVIYPLRSTLSDLAAMSGMLPSVRLLIDGALPQLNRFGAEHGAALFERACRLVDAATVFYSRADSQVMRWRMNVPTPGPENTGMEIVIGRDVPEAAQVRVDGSSRPAYRVGCPGGVSKAGEPSTRWASVPASLFGGGGAAPGDLLPVFVQAHALRQMHERLDLPGFGPWAEYHLAHSLFESKVARGCGDGGVLVEYRVHERKVGYLVVSRAGGRALVRTFLLLTMAGTPEGERLARRLRLTRDEARWLGLHRLSSLAASDVRDDAELVGILGECGCGQLAEVARGVDFVPVTTGYAAELRKYIGLASSAAVADGAGAAGAGGGGGGGTLVREAA